ncbi:hypothetical protein FE74_14945, partial [Staphylococcus aureus]
HRDTVFTWIVNNLLEREHTTVCVMIIVTASYRYLEMARDVKDHTTVPVVAYNVRGEYSMTKAAAQNGWIDEERVVMEQLVSMK